MGGVRQAVTVNQPRYDFPPPPDFQPDMNRLNLSGQLRKVDKMSVEFEFESAAGRRRYMQMRFARVDMLTTRWSSWNLYTWKCSAVTRMTDAVIFWQANSLLPAKPSRLACRIGWLHANVVWHQFECILCRYDDWILDHQPSVSNNFSRKLIHFVDCLVSWVMACSSRCWLCELMLNVVSMFLVCVYFMCSGFFSSFWSYTKKLSLVIALALTRAYSDMIVSSSLLRYVWDLKQSVNRIWAAISLLFLLDVLTDRRYATNVSI